MRPKASKRQRKHKDTQSLKRKQSANQQHHVLDLLSEQQEGEEGGCDLLQLTQPAAAGEHGCEGSNALLLPASKAGSGKSGASTHAAEQQQQPLSKTQIKKLKQVQQKKERRAQLSQVLSQLNSSSLDAQHLALLRPLHQRGAKETRRQRLARAQQMQQAGLAGDEGGGAGGAQDVRALQQQRQQQQRRQRKRQGGRREWGASSDSDSGSDSGASSSSGESGSESDADANGGASAQQQPSAGPLAAAPAAAAPAAQPRKRAKLADAFGLTPSQPAAAATADGQSQQQQQQQQDPAATKAQLAALRAEAHALKAQAKQQAAAEGAAPLMDDAEAEEAAAAAAAAAERAAAAAAGPTRVVHLPRPAEMQAARQALPIIGLEQEIMEGISRHDVVVLCGETGCGKTTQVPQFLMEAGYGCARFPEKSGAICVTQPRRVAAISTAERVAAELGVKMGSSVGYQVRHDKRVGPDSAVRFLTDGVLMRQLQSDFLLRAYSVVLLDEAHERSLNTDLLLGMLSRLVPLRRRLHEQWKAAGCPGAAGANTASSASSASASAAAPAASAAAQGPVYPLKLVIMSATLRTADFTANSRLFPAPPPVLSVPARQFPVTIHFSRHTELQDYLGAAVRKVCRIHRELPPGGILLFVTGQREVQVAVRRIRQTFAAATGSGSGASGRQRGQGPQGCAAAAAAAAAPTGAGGSGGGAAAAAAAEGDGDHDDDDSGGAAAGADAAELAADAADAALAADLADAAAGDAAGLIDDYAQLEADEDEDEVVVMGGEGWSPEELAAAEARFEQVYGHSLGSGGSIGGGGGSTGTGGGGDGGGRTGGTAGGGAGQGQEDHHQQGQQLGRQQGPQQRGAAPVHVLPLYAMLPQAQQAAVFAPVPAGHRLVVVATNVAETSITIPGIRYVVDAGRSKRKLLESSYTQAAPVAAAAAAGSDAAVGPGSSSAVNASGTAGGSTTGAIARYAVDWVSKAAAEQRAGRAGRTGPGHVYRLYSSAHYNNSFSQHTDPEIANTPLEGVVLLLKAMGVDKVENFPFPSPPEPEALTAATQALVRLSALSPPPIPAPRGSSSSSQAAAAAAAAAAAGSGPLTALGSVMAVFPISPRHSRMLLQLAVWRLRQLGSGGCAGLPPAVAAGSGPVGAVSAAAAAEALPYAVALAAVLSCENPFKHLDALAAEREAAAAAAAGARAEGAGDGDDQREGGSKQQRQADRASAEAKAASRRRMQAASAAHARLCSAAGDAFSALQALCGYEAAAATRAPGAVEAFCADNFLHARHLREMSQLRQQLGRTLLQLQQHQGQQRGGPAAAAAAAMGGGGGAHALLHALKGAVEDVGRQALAAPLRAPPQRVVDVLRRALAAGWCDQVSRRVRSADYIARLESEGRLGRHATRYLPACLAQEVFLHPRSVLTAAAPEFVVYLGIVATPKRPYMATVAAIEPQWLADVGSSLCTVSEPLAEPAPAYQPALDAVLAWHEAAYSRHAWPLPRLLLPHPDAAARAAAFGSALLAGHVCPAMAALQGALVAPAGSAARPELAGLARVGELVAALKAAQVFSRAALAAAWARQPAFLKPQLALWVHKQQRQLLEGVWPALLQEAAAAGAGAGGSSSRGKSKGKRRAQQGQR